MYVGLGLFLGLLLGTTLVIGSAYLDKKWRGPEQAKEDLALPLLGIVESVDKSSPAVFSAMRIGLQSLAPEASVILLGQVGGTAMKIAGKLAQSLTAADKRVLLIDCDLEEGRLSKLMDAEGARGLAELLDDPNLPAAVRPTDFDKVAFLPAGTGKGSAPDLLSRESFASVMRSMRERYDRIILYPPAFGASIIPLTVAPQADASILVLQLDNAGREEAIGAARSLQAFHGRAVGLVITGARAGKGERPWQDLVDLGTIATLNRRGLAASVAAALPVERNGAAINDEQARQQGAAGEKMPREWIELLLSSESSQRDDAVAAISSYYQGMLMQSGVTKAKALEVAGAVIAFLEKKGAYSQMTKAEMESHIREMLETGS